MIAGEVKVYRSGFDIKKKKRDYDHSMSVTYSEPRTRVGALLCMNHLIQFLRAL